MPDAYVPKNPNDLIKAADWNLLQIEARNEIQTGHDHTGGEKGLQIGTDALAAGSVTLEKLHADVMAKLESIEQAVADAVLRIEQLEAGLGGDGYDVELVSPGPDGNAVVEILIGELGLDEAEAKALVENVPSILRSGVPLEEAENLASLLTGVGAEVEVKPSSGSGGGKAVEMAQEAMAKAESAEAIAKDAMTKALVSLSLHDQANDGSSNGEALALAQAANDAAQAASQAAATANNVAQAASQAANEAHQAANEAHQAATQGISEVQQAANEAMQAAAAAMTKANSVDSIAKEALTKAKIGLSLDYALHGQDAKNITSP